MSFELDISDKDLASALYMTEVNRRLISDFVRVSKAKKLTRKQIADALGIDKAGVTRMLSGSANLTSRTIGELCWALGVTPHFLTEMNPTPHNGTPIETHEPARSKVQERTRAITQAYITNPTAKVMAVTGQGIYTNAPEKA